MSFAVFVGSLAYGKASADSYAELVDRYRHGHPEEAVAEFATWTEARIAADVKPPEATTDLWTRAAMAALNLEGDFRRATSIQPSGTSERHPRTLVAEGFIHDLVASARSAHDDALVRFCHEWTLVAGTLSVRFTWFDPLIGNALRLDFPADPQFLLLAGAEAELDMGPARPGDGPEFRLVLNADPEVVSLHTGKFNREVAFNAETQQRKALAADPTLLEARLHLGRTLSTVSRPADAQAELERTLRDARANGDGFVAYLAALFLGQIQDDAHRPTEARDYYTQATVINPTAPSAWLAIGQLELAQGNDAAGWTALGHVFGTGSPAGHDDVDPWYLYPTPFFVSVPNRILALRNMVRP